MALRPCLRCGALIPAGSYCRHHKPRPASPGRVTGRRLQKRRTALIAAQGGRCAYCGAQGALQLHHRDHNHLNDDPANWVMICARCHGKAGIRRHPGGSAAF
jgi:5-methylcytosine-specific restriction endonuclease McrA